jgi:hypothetical protein
VKVFVAVEACDMRKGFNGLHALVAEYLAADAMTVEIQLKKTQAANIGPRLPDFPAS